MSVERLSEKDASVLRFFSVNWSSREDGPGERVVLFLQGCHLQCPWCHSPHSRPKNSPLLFHESLCTRCGQCVRHCPHGVHTIVDGRHSVNREACTQCGLCVAHCPQSHPQKTSSALRLPTREIAVDDLFAWLRPQLEMHAPRGGLTISGGEPLLQVHAVRALLQKARQAGIHTAVETSGELPSGPVESLAEWVDLWLFGLRSYARTPGAPPTLSPLALANLDVLAAKDNTRIRIRLPLIPGYTDSAAAIAQVRHAMAERHLDALELLPYNPDTQHYYHAIGQPYNPAQNNVQNTIQNTVQNSA